MLYTIKNLRKNRLWLTIMVIGLMAIAPFLNDYVLFELSFLAVYALALLGLNLLIGYTGQFSLGHGAFFTLGACTVAFFLQFDAIPVVVALAGVLVVCFLAGVLIGLPALKLEGHYLALVTFALALALPQLLKWEVLKPLTGGTTGIAVVRDLVPPWWAERLDISTELIFFYMVVSVFLICAHIIINGLSSNNGLAMVAIRDQPVAAVAVGIRIRLYKTIVFGISSALTGLAGAFCAFLVGLVAPDSFDLMLSIYLVVGAVVGGVATVSGALVGGAVIQFLPNIASWGGGDLADAVYGIILIGLMWVARSGIIGTLRRYL